MAQRGSGYARIAGDHYATPAWVVDKLLMVEDFPESVWEVAPGDGHMVRALEARGVQVVWHDCDFFDYDPLPGFCRSVVTNPPFSSSQLFVTRALNLTKAQHGKVAMLLPVNWDCAKGRVDLFLRYPLKAKYILTQRIRWENLEQKKAGPSTNHAWFVWDWTRDQPHPYLRWL